MFFLPTFYFFFFSYFIILQHEQRSKYVEKEKNARNRKREEFIYKISYRYVTLISSNEI